MESDGDGALASQQNSPSPHSKSSIVSGQGDPGLSLHSPPSSSHSVDIGGEVQLAQHILRISHSPSSDPHAQDGPNMVVHVPLISPHEGIEHGMQQTFASSHGPDRGGQVPHPIDPG